MTKQIPLTRGLFATVDDEDYERLSRFKWMAKASRNTFYATRAQWNNGKRVDIYMHKEIVSSGSHPVTDHRDGDGLNNVRANLRPASLAENRQNRPHQRNNSSGYKGVGWFPASRKWRAQIKKDGKHKHIGLFSSPEEAARAYDSAAKEAFGEFAYLNFR